MGIVFGYLLGFVILPLSIGLVTKLLVDTYSVSVYKRPSRNFSWLIAVLIMIGAGAIEYYFVDQIPPSFILSVALFGLPALLILGVFTIARKTWQKSVTGDIQNDYNRIRKKWVRAWLIFCSVPAIIALLLMAAPSTVDAADYFSGLVMWLFVGLVSYPLFILGTKIHLRKLQNSNQLTPP